MILERLCKKIVMTTTKTTTLAEAAKLMRDTHVGDLVVVEDHQEKGEVPVGMLTDRDIVMSSVALGIDPNALQVKDVMSTELITAKIQDSVSHVIHLMKEYGCQRIPVVNMKGALIGIVSEADLIAFLANELAVLSNLPREQKNIEMSKRRSIA